MTTPDHVLLLAGTLEARKLAEEFKNSLPELRVTVSFAGAVQDLPDLGMPTCVGGFGGIDGLSEFLVSEHVALVIDATHPFAAQMSFNAAGACHKCGVPLLRLERPAWEPTEGDVWMAVASIEEAASVLPEASRAFVAVGRKEISRFYQRSDIYGLARMIEAPLQPVPRNWDLVLSRPASNVAEEISLLRKHAITHLVAKNSGGMRSYAKIEAARELGLPVVMIGRPVLPDAETAPGFPEILDKVKLRLGSRRA